MNLELELLVNAWDNYTKNVIKARKIGPVLTDEETIFVNALNALIDALEPKGGPAFTISREEIVKYEGKRVRLVRDVERFPHFIAKKGTYGTVLVASLTECTVELDEPLKGAEEWDNSLIWQNAYEFVDDVELISKT